MYLGIWLLQCSSAFAWLSWQVLAELGKEWGRQGKGLVVDLAFSCTRRTWQLCGAGLGSILRDFPFPLQAFPTGKGPDFCSDWCSEGNLPGSLQQLHGAAPAAPEPAGSGGRAQGTAPCSAPWLHKHVSLLRAWKRFHFVVCLVATGRSQPLTCTWLPSLLFHPWSPKASGGPWRPSRGRSPAAFQLNGRVVLWFPALPSAQGSARSCLVSRVADGILPWKWSP